MIKIVIATGIYPPNIGGPATYAKLMKENLPKYGFAVDVLSFDKVRKFPKFLRHVVYFFDLIKIAIGKDIIFAQDTVSVGFPAMLAAKILGKKFVVRVPGDYAWEQSVQRFGVKDSIDDFQNKKYGFRVEFLRKIQKKVVKRADVVIAPSEYFKKLVSGWGSNKVTRVYNGIELKEVYGNREVLRKELGIERGKKIIFSAGRLIPWKGFDVLIKVLKKLVAKSSDYELIIAGDGPEKAKLDKLIKENDLSQNVCLVGTLARETLLKYLKASDVFVLNTHFESFSFQIVEAMYYEIPVVATRIGNLEEIIENGREGILVEPDNENQIIEAVEKITNDGNFRKEIVYHAKEKSKNFSIENTLSQVSKILKS